MKKAVLRFIIAMIAVSMVGTFSLVGCQPTAVETTEGETAAATEGETAAAEEAEFSEKDALEQNVFGRMNPEKPVPKEKWKIGFVVQGLNHPYSQDIQKGYLAAAADFGDQIELIEYDCQLDATIEIKMIEAAIQDQVDIVILHAVDPALGPRISQMLKDAGIVLLGCDTHPGLPNHFIGLENFKNGFLSGQRVGKMVKEAGWDYKNDLMYFQLWNTAFYACTLRGNGIRAGFLSEIPDFPVDEKWIDTDIGFSAEDVQPNFADLITANPSKYYAVSGCIETNALGAAAALKAAGYTPDTAMVTTCGGTAQDREELMREGTLLVGASLQRPEEEAVGAVFYAIRILNGEEVPSDVVHYPFIGTKDTLGDFYPWSYKGYYDARYELVPEE